jgi:hypothetical protein|tara:strand:- start:794 stop:1588 length:795 start_codon:yes stop_codon:yes gene_type:complete
MGELKKISGAYGGGSPRKNYKASKITTTNLTESKNVFMYEGVVKSLYLNNQVSSGDVQHFIHLLVDLKNHTPTSGDLSSLFILTLFNPITDLYKGGLVDDQFITNLISKLTAILELTQFPSPEPNIKEKLSILDNVKNSQKIQKVKSKSKIDTSIKPQELNEVIKIIDKKFIHKEFTKSNLTVFINSLKSLYVDDFIFSTTQNNPFLSSTLEYLKDLHGTNKLTDVNLEYLTTSLSNTLTLTQIDKPVKQIKDKISALSKNYKK